MLQFGPPAAATPQAARALRGHALFGAVFRGHTPSTMGIEWEGDWDSSGHETRPLVLLFKPKEERSLDEKILQTCEQELLCVCVCVCFCLCLCLCLSLSLSLSFCVETRLMTFMPGIMLQWMASNDYPGCFLRAIGLGSAIC